MRDKIFEELLGYDKDAIENEVFEKLTTFVNNPISQPEEICQISHAAYKLSTWMHAVHSYGCILRELEPKKNALRDANQNIIEVCYIFLTYHNCLRDIFNFPSFLIYN